MASQAVYRLNARQYCHVLNTNENVTYTLTGPRTYTRLDHEQVVLPPTDMLLILPRHYATIQNPVMRDANGAVLFDKHGQARVRHGDEEIRFESPDPFPLYPGEKLFGRICPLQVVAANQALRLRCVRDFVDSGPPKNVAEARAAAAVESGAAPPAAGKTKAAAADGSSTTSAAAAAAAAAAGGVRRKAGEEWVLEGGPITYWPRVSVQVVEVIRAVIVQPNQALKLRARKECVDAAGTRRRAGECWLHKTPGAFIAQVDHEVVATVNAFVLTDKRALHLRATRTFTDVYGVKRNAGAEWLVRVSDAPMHMCDVFEEVVGEVRVTTLTSRQYAVVLDPYDEASGALRLGQKELRKGECSFFLRPGERLERGVQSVYVLGEDEALLLSATEAHDGHEAGNRWAVYGPCDYVPPTTVQVIEKRRAIPLDVNEGVYVRDIKTGYVTMVTGKSYMLAPNEELFEKELPPVVERLLAAANSAGGGATGAPRDRTRVVSYRAPHNTAVQIYDYKEKRSRVVLGPELVLLGPDEQFTVLSLSGDKPKRPHVVKALALQFGPAYFTDVLVVETSDHARLSLQLSYNWFFTVDPEAPERAFSVPDFVGDACKAIASRVRGAVAASTFAHFHTASSNIIRQAVFGADVEGRPRNRFTFAANGLTISNIDIQSVEPVDQRTRESLQKSVQLAIEITTKSQEATARHEAERLEQEAKGRLERQRIEDEALAEQARTELLQLLAQSSTVEATGTATSEAQARAAAESITGEANLKVAELRARAQQVTAAAELDMLKKKQEVEVALAGQRNALEIEKARRLAEIEAKKQEAMISALGRECIVAMARAGPANEAAMLRGLGLSSVVITDGNAPVSLVGAAKGLLSGIGGGSGGGGGGAQ